MIRIELGEEIKRRGVWRYSVPAYGVEGRSRQPLLDACREIKRTGGDTVQAAGLFRAGRSEPDLVCRSVEIGAGRTVSDPDSGIGGIRLVRFREYPVEIHYHQAEAA